MELGLLGAAILAAFVTDHLSHRWVYGHGHFGSLWIFVSLFGAAAAALYGPPVGAGTIVVMAGVIFGHRAISLRRFRDVRVAVERRLIEGSEGALTALEASLARAAEEGGAPHLLHFYALDHLVAGWDGAAAERCSKWPGAERLGPRERGHLVLVRAWARVYVGDAKGTRDALADAVLAADQVASGELALAMADILEGDVDAGLARAERVREPEQEPALGFVRLQARAAKGDPRAEEDLARHPRATWERVAASPLPLGRVARKLLAEPGPFR